jgi:hypothetical protein
VSSTSIKWFASLTPNLSESANAIANAALQQCVTDGNQHVRLRLRKTCPTTTSHELHFLTGQTPSQPCLIAPNNSFQMRYSPPTHTAPYHTITQLVTLVLFFPLEANMKRMVAVWLALVVVVGATANLKREVAPTVHWWIHDAIAAREACGNIDEWTTILADLIAIHQQPTVETKTADRRRRRRVQTNKYCWIHQMSAGSWWPCGSPTNACCYTGIAARSIAQPFQ